MLSKEYVAGFFDGEGHIGITIAGKNKQCTLRLTFVNTNREVLEMIRLAYGGNIHSTSTSNSWTPSYRPDWKPSWQLKLSFSEIKRLVVDIQPYVIVKAAQIKLALEFIDFMNSDGRLFKGKRTEEVLARESKFKTSMHILNKVGA